MLLVHHIADHHLKRLHGDINARIQEHQTEESEPHCGIQAEERSLREGEVTCIRQEKHYRNSDERAHEQIGFTTAETIPGLIRIFTNKRLHNHTHERRKNPEETKRVRIRTEGSEDTGDIRALQRVSDLYSEESETQIEELCK